MKIRKGWDLISNHSKLNRGDLVRNIVHLILADRVNKMNEASTSMMDVLLKKKTSSKFDIENRFVYHIVWNVSDDHSLHAMD